MEKLWLEHSGEMWIRCTFRLAYDVSFILVID